MKGVTVLVILDSCNASGSAHVVGVLLILTALQIANKVNRSKGGGGGGVLAYQLSDIYDTAKAKTTTTGDCKFILGFWMYHRT